MRVDFWGKVVYNVIKLVKCGEWKPNQDERRGTYF